MSRPLWWCALALLIGAAAQADDAEPAEAESDASDAVVAALPVPFEPSAGEVPFSEPIAPIPPGPPVWEFAGQLATGVGDPFHSKVATLFTARRRVASWPAVGALSVEVFGGRAFSWPSPALELCPGSGSCAAPSPEQLASTPGRLDWVGGAAGVLRAAEGKLSFGGLRAITFGLDVSGGVAAMGYRIFEGTERSSFGPGLRLGVGLASELTPSITVRVELQRFAYLARLRSASSLENQTLLGASIAWRPGGQP